MGNKKENIADFAWPLIIGLVFSIIILTGLLTLLDTLGCLE